MHSFTDLVLQAEFGVDIIKGDFLVVWGLMTDIIFMKWDVVQAVFFALGWLPVSWQKIDIGVIPEILNVMNIRTLMPFFFTIASHVEPAYKSLMKIFRQFLHPFLLVLPHNTFIHLAILLDGFELLWHICWFVFDEVHTTGSEWRHYNIDLSISFDKREVADKVSELAEGLCLFESDLAKPGAKHADSVVHVRTQCFYEVDKFIPLLSMHNFPDSVPHCIILVDFGNAQGLVAWFLVPFRELIGVQPKVVQVFNKEERSLMKICFFEEEPLLLFFFS